ncbi:uncharacterized protein LOC110975966 [Acanthaster planci]|uniref:Uncharacterized protein LOC110975966 n=1 Tax=Acanthaster planci TaxID=133434 RepID=A0A8B7XWC1_ACAPL|nr:uncharacterized protein LOC110975966 [Acanthaster planci]
MGCFNPNCFAELSLAYYVQPEPSPKGQLLVTVVRNRKPAYLHQVDHFDWAPTKNMGYTRAPQNQDTLARYNRLKQQKRKADDVAAASALLELQQTGRRNTQGLEEPPLTR